MKQIRVTLAELKKIVSDIETDMHYQTGENYIEIDIEKAMYKQPCVYAECNGRTGVFGKLVK